MKIGVLLLNTGTPENCDKHSVGKYLREFLMDGRVVDLPWFFRWILVNLLIVPTRAKNSAEAYQKIWNNGSPLLSHCLGIKNALSERLGENYVVELGMRYGKPNIPAAIKKLQEASCEKWMVIPLFPQYASASTGSVLEQSLWLIQKEQYIPSIYIKSFFYDEPLFIQAYARLIQKDWIEKKSDFILFTYHGLPERHIKKIGCSSVCSANCPDITSVNATCYRAQCFKTSQLLAEKLGLPAEKYATVFQSRLGKTPWIKPYTDEYLSKLIQKNIQNLQVVSPSFTADCLETLEELGIRLKEQWEKSGGKNFTLTPCLNTEPEWIDMLYQTINENHL